jgi:hypothetical protein
MADRENSPAYAALPRSARRVFAAIQQAAIGDGSSASVSYVPPHRSVTALTFIRHLVE